MNNRSLQAKLALVIALALILAALVFVWWSAPKPVSMVPAQAATSVAPAPTAHEPLAAPDIETPTPRASAADALAVAASTTATLIVICRAKETGKPLTDIEAYLIPMDPKHVAEQAQGTYVMLGPMLTTAETGRVEFEIPAGVQAKLYLHPKERVLTEAVTRDIAALTAGERRELVVELMTREDVRFYIRVIARETRLPCAGAQVTMSGDQSFNGRCDADGRFDLSCPSWAPKLLHIYLDGFADAEVVTRIRHDTPDKALEILLERGATLIGVLEGSPDTTGKPLTFDVMTESYRFKQQVDLDGLDVSTSNRHARQVFDGSGRAVLTDLLPGAPLRVTVTKGLAIALTLTKEITLEPGETREIVLHIDEGCLLSGTVRDEEHQPVAGQVLWLLPADRNKHPFFELSDDRQNHATAKSDADGRYKFEHVQAGSWRLGPAAEVMNRKSDDATFAKAVAPLVTQVEIAVGNAERTVDLILYRGLTIRGTVLDPAGAPTAKASVQGRSGALFVNTQPKADGTFILGPLSPGPCKLFAQSFGDSASSEEVEARAGATDVVLQLRSGATLAGRVVDATSGEACSARFVLSHLDGTPGMISDQQTTPDGTFKIEGLLPGRVAIAARTSDGRTGSLPSVQVTSGMKLENLVIQVTRGAKLRVRYDGKASVGQATILHDGLVVDADGVESGTATTFLVPAGAVHVEFQIYTPRKKIVRELTLAAGEEREILFKDDD